jgi:hypothetical protein
MFSWTKPTVNCTRSPCLSSYAMHRRAFGGASSEAYFRVDELLRQLANPNLHDIPRNLPFRVEMWDQGDQHVRWVIAASASVAVGHAAMDAAIASYPDQRFTLRNGILVIRQHPRAWPRAVLLQPRERVPINKTKCCATKTLRAEDKRMTTYVYEYPSTSSQRF